MSGSRRERALAERTLVCLLQACQGHKVTVELRNESFAEGTVDLVDGYMNVNMSKVELTKINSKTVRLEELFIQGRQIRYVHIPDEINMRDAIEHQLKALRSTRTFTGKKSRRTLGR